MSERVLTEDDDSDRSELKDIPPAPRGVFQLERTFEIDANGIMKVSAVAGKGGNQSVSITVTDGKAGFLRRDRE